MTTPPNQNLLLWRHHLIPSLQLAPKTLRQTFSTPLGTDIGPGGSYLAAYRPLLVNSMYVPKLIYCVDVGHILQGLRYDLFDSPDALDRWFYDELSDCVGKLGVGQYMRESDVAFARRLLAEIVLMMPYGEAAVEWAQGKATDDEALEETSKVHGVLCTTKMLSEYWAIQIMRAFLSEPNTIGAARVCHLLHKRNTWRSTKDEKLPFDPEDRQRIWRSAHWFRCYKNINVNSMIPRGVDP